MTTTPPYSPSDEPRFAGYTLAELEAAWASIDAEAGVFDASDGYGGGRMMRTRQEIRAQLQRPITPPSRQSDDPAQDPS